MSRCGRGKDWAWAVAGWLVSAREPEGTTAFQLHQPKRLSFNDGFSCDDDKPAGRCVAPEFVECTPTGRRRQLSRN